MSRSTVNSKLLLTHWSPHVQTSVSAYLVFDNLMINFDNSYIFTSGMCLASIRGILRAIV